MGTGWGRQGHQAGWCLQEVPWLACCLLLLRCRLLLALYLRSAASMGDGE
jgi:hypothetical protein